MLVGPGSVTPFALINDTEKQVNVILDTRLLRVDEAGFHPLTNDATTLITPQGLQKFIMSLGYIPREVDFEEIYNI